MAKGKAQKLNQENREILQGMVDELCDLDEGLSGWAVTFIDDMAHRFKVEPDTPIYLTEAQANKIIQLHEEHC